MLAAANGAGQEPPTDALRTLLSTVTSQSAASARSGRRLLARVGRLNLVNRAVKIGLVLFVIWLGGLVIWASGSLPVYSDALAIQHIVPADTVSPEEAARLDLEAAGLAPGPVRYLTDGVAASWHDRLGRDLVVTMRHLPTAEAAALAYQELVGSGAIQISPVRNDSPNRSVAVRWVPLGRQYVWQTGSWLIEIRVPIWMLNLDSRLVQVRDLLLKHFTQMQPGTPTPPAAAPK